jgi:hypothetical protein
MIRKITVIAVSAALLVASMAQAAERRGDFAIGFSTDDAPVGLRYFTSDRFAFDLGLGFESIDQGEESASSFFAEVGGAYVLVDYGNAFFFVRPAVKYSKLDDRVYGTGTTDAAWSQIDISANLGAEVRLAERFGLTFQHGLRYSSLSVPDEVQEDVGTDSFTDFFTFGENVTEAGVWFTF